ncbi:MAG TPA: ATP-grasp domain-containing protein [Candidatus Coprenecus stercorigallinarum]|nr:ATP-grasp domain-containing protein [Candidatus Coprenecus stercorigallinarum]
MPRRKLMLLGGLRYLLPVIDAAHSLGCHVITCDYLPDNIAHKYSDEYHNVSILDREAVLSLARELRIDGIMSFAVDPGVVTAAYVADRLGLPCAGPYESIYILQDKEKFRGFLETNGFNVPKSKGFSSYEEAYAARDYFAWPVIVKPVDSAGSKGVSRVDSRDDLRPAFDNAMFHSFSGKVIIEEFIEKEGCSSDSDCFSVDGKLEFVSFSAQRFDENADNPYTPAAYSWPSTFTKGQETELTAEIQRLLTLLQMRTSIYNIETRIGTNGRPYIMEVSPRGGGNRLAEMLRMATGVDMITAAVKAALGEKVTDIVQKPYDGHWAEVILHADRSGTFRGLDISPEMSSHVVERDLWVREGERVSSFNGANDAIGTLVLKLDSLSELESIIRAQGEWLKVRID